MCEPTTIIAGAALAMQVGGTVAEAVGQNKASAANKKEARRAQLETEHSIGLREQQEQDATALTIKQTQDEGRSAVSLARASASEAGVAGNSVDALYADLERDTATMTQIQRTNLALTLDQLQQDKRSAAAGAQSRINSVPGANPFLTGLQIGGAGLNFYGQMSARQPAKATASSGTKTSSGRAPSPYHTGTRGPSE